MKKIYIWLFLMSCFLVAFSSQATDATEKLPAENAIVSSGQTTMDVKIDGQAFAQQSEHIQKVEVDFCGFTGVKAVNYDYKLWSTYELCYAVQNRSDQDVAVDIWFVDGMLTNDQWQNKACWTPDKVDNFGKYVTWYKTQLLLRKWESKTAHAKIYFPKDAVTSWFVMHGCLVYSLSSNEDETNIPLGVGILVRKAKFIDLHIKKGISFDRKSLLLIVALLGIGYRIYRKKMFSSRWK